MTEEEIRPIAENYVEEYCHCSDGEYTDGDLVCAGIGTALIVSRQLEKRIAELEESLGKMQKSTFDMIDKKNNRITELEKENAELKEYNKYLRRQRQGGIQKQYNKVAIIKQQDEQLTKAKEIIKLLLWDLRNRSYEPVKDIERAEQFLKNDGCPDVMCEDCTKEDCGVRQLGLVKVEK